VCDGIPPENLIREPDVSYPACAYPVKGLSPEPLPRVELGVGQTLPADRRYAIENGPSNFDPAAPVWMPKSYFLMLMRNERLAGLQTHFEDHTNLLTIRADGKVVARGDLETEPGRVAIEAFFATNFSMSAVGRLGRSSNCSIKSSLSARRA
jgi:hypothetical protein